MKIKLKKRRKLCKCGCGEYAKTGNRFLIGHSSRMDWVRDKIAEKHLGKILSEKHKRKIGLAHAGEKNGFYGKHHSDETKNILRKQRIGRPLSEETKSKIRANALRGDDNPARRPEVREKIGIKSKGRVHSLETKRKMSESHKGYKHTEETKAKIKETRLYGDDNPARRPEVRKLISKKSKVRFQNPENHPSWKGGIAAEPYCDVWLDKEYKQSILERDNHQCQNPDCWKIKTDSTIHHVDYDKKNCHPWNLITLCRSCNSRANSNRNSWTEFYQKIMNFKKEAIN